jgi:hypothetical protein
MFKLTLTIVFGFFLMNIPVQATTLVTSSEATTINIEKQKTELKKEFKKQKRAEKLAKFLAKAGIDFQDPVEKWLWFGIIGLLGGIVLGWTVLWALGGLVSAAGFVCIVIWAVKKFS